MVSKSKGATALSKQSMRLVKGLVPLVGFGDVLVHDKVHEPVVIVVTRRLVKSFHLKFN